MNTKTDGISSGLVASIYLAFSDDEENIRFWTSNAFHAVEWAQENWETEAFVRLSDAKAIIAQKDAEILDQCRINGMGAEREATLLGKVERQSAALKLAREALGEVQDLISESHGVYGLHLNGDESPWSELEQGGRFERLTALPEAIAAIDALGE